MAKTKVWWKMILDPPEIPGTHTHVLNDITDAGTIASKNYGFGTLTDYNAIPVKDANTIYFIEE